VYLYLTFFEDLLEVMKSNARYIVRSFFEKNSNIFILLFIMALSCVIKIDYKIDYLSLKKNFL